MEDKNGKSLAERMTALLNTLHLSAPKFAERVGVKYKRIYDITSGRVVNVKSELIDHILRAYPDFNSEYLMTGQMPMFNKPAEAPMDDRDIEDMVRSIISSEEYHQRAQAVAMREEAVAKRESILDERTAKLDEMARTLIAREAKLNDLEREIMKREIAVERAKMALSEAPE